MSSGVEVSVTSYIARGYTDRGIDIIVYIPCFFFVGIEIHHCKVKLIICRQVCSALL